MTIVDHIVRAANGMPQGGGYVWNNDRTDGGGCLKDLVHPDGSVILKAGRGTYCCGLTLEMLWRGWESYSKASGEPFMRGLSADRAKQLQRAWFCIGTRKGAQDALVSAGLGVPVRREEARLGDFVQFWRTNGSGHSALVVSLARGRLAYLSTQKKTNGFGSNVEPEPREIYIVRPTA